MKNWKRKLDLAIYDSSIYAKPALDVRKQKANVEEIAEITYAKLCVATAKAILVNAVKFSPNLMNFARSYFHIIPFMLTEKDGYLVFNNKNKDVLRDFSKSARIGEIAQGVNYQIAFDKLNVYAVYDYKDFVRNVAHIKKKIVGRTPDFVLCYKDGTIGVLESKGTMVANPTGFLVNGKEQFENGCTFLNSNGILTKNGYASAVSFATSSKRMKRKSTIYMVDPENEKFEEPEMLYKDNVLRECSKYLCLAGDIDLANEFRKGISAIEEIKNRIEGKNLARNLVVGSFDMIMENNKKVNIEIGLSEALIEYIYNDRNDIINFDSYVNDNTEFFSDGTYLRINV